MRAYKVFHIIQSGSSHHRQDALFIETDLDGRGTIIQLTGSSRTGMRVECSAQTLLDDNSWDMLSKEHIGWVTEAKFDYIRQVARMVPPPRSQEWRYVEEHGGGRLTRSTQEWTAVLIRRLVVDGIMEKEIGEGGSRDWEKYLGGNSSRRDEEVGPRYLVVAEEEVEEDISEEE